MEQLSKNVEMPTCPVSKLRKLCDNTSLLEPDAEITLALVLSATFPTVWSNVERALQDYYTQGYLAGLKQGQESINGH